MINIILSSTQLDDAWGCPRKLNFEKVLGLQLKPENKDHKRLERDYKRDRGTLFHKLLEKYYKAKMQNVKIDADLVVAIMNYGRGHGSTELSLPEEHVEKTVRKFRDYHTEYQNESYIVEGVEESFHRLLFEDEHTKIALEGTIDLRVTNASGQKLVVDHKSGSWEVGFLSNQFMTYAFLSGYNMVIENKCSIDGAGFSRTTHQYTERLLDEWKQSTINQILRIAGYEQKKDYPPDFTRCMAFGGCQFYDLCSQDPQHRASMIQAEYEFKEDDHFKERFEGKG